jgi:hypothetical protein
MTLLLLPAVPALAQSAAPAPATPCAGHAAAVGTVERSAAESLLAPLRDRWNSADAGQRQRMLSASAGRR